MTSADPLAAPASSVTGGGLVHAEDPRCEGRALCGAVRLGAPASPAQTRCAVCEDLVARSFTAR